MSWLVTKMLWGQLSLQGTQSAEPVRGYNSSQRVCRIGLDFSLTEFSPRVFLFWRLPVRILLHLSINLQTKINLLILSFFKKYLSSVLCPRIQYWGKKDIFPSPMKLTNSQKTERERLLFVANFVNKIGWYNREYLLKVEILQSTMWSVKASWAWGYQMWRRKRVTQAESSEEHLPTWVTGDLWGWNRVKERLHCTTDECIVRSPWTGSYSL